MAGPLAGALGLPFSTFLIANLLGAVVYVPIVVGLGYYGLGYGLGAYLEQLRDLGADLEGLILLVALVGFAGILAWRIVRAIPPRRRRLGASAVDVGTGRPRSLVPRPFREPVGAPKTLLRARNIPALQLLESARRAP